MSWTPWGHQVSLSKPPFKRCDPCRAVEIAKAVVEDFKVPDHIMGEKEWITVDTPRKRYVRKQVIELLVNEIIPKLKESKSKEARESGEILQDWLHKCDAGDTPACIVAINLLKSFLHRSEETRKAIACRASDDIFKLMDDLEPLVSIGETEKLDKSVKQLEAKWCSNPDDKYGEEEELTEEEARKRLKKLFRGETLDAAIEAGKVEPLDKWLSVILILAFIPATLIATHTYYSMVVSHAS